jgi:phage terminase large subunit
MEISRDDIISTELQDFGADRFIKIPIQNYLDLIGIDPVPPQMALINAVNNPKYRFITAVLNRRTGKSYMANIIGHLVTLMPGANILVIAPNYSLSSISWDLQRTFINAFDIETERSNAKDKIIELKNGSTIRMGSVSQVDSVVGRSYDLIIFDEAALNDNGESAYNIQLRPTLDKPNSKAVFISTPRGKNWFYDFYKRGFNDKYPTWASIRSTWHDNPRASIEDVEDARASMSKAEFAQEYESDFIALEGQVYYLNKQNIIEIDVDKIDKLDVIAGLDVGFRDDTAMVVIYTDGVNFYVVQDYLNKQKSTSKYALDIQEMIDEHNIDFIYADASAAQTRADLAYDYDITTIKSKKSVLDGIGYVASLVDNDRIFIDSSCTDTIEMFDSYVWDSKEGLINERPKHGPESHIADALRYALYTHSYNVVGFGE